MTDRQQTLLVVCLKQKQDCRQWGLCQIFCLHSPRKGKEFPCRQELEAPSYSRALRPAWGVPLCPAIFFPQIPLLWLQFCFSQARISIHNQQLRPASWSVCCHFSVMRCWHVNNSVCQCLWERCAGCWTLQWPCHSLHCNVLPVSICFLNKTLCPSSIWKEMKIGLLMVLMLKFWGFFWVCVLGSSDLQSFGGILQNRSWEYLSFHSLWKSIWDGPTKPIKHSSQGHQVGGNMWMGMLGRHPHQQMCLRSTCLVISKSVGDWGCPAEERGLCSVVQLRGWTSHTAPHCARQTPGSILEGFAKIVFGCSILM